MLFGTDCDGGPDMVDDHIEAAVGRITTAPDWVDRYLPA
jgi:hypothetical protein